MNIISNLYKKFVNGGMDKETALNTAEEIAFRPVADEKCRKCQSKKCFSGKYGPFCPEGRPNY